jgi:hypothetical protein
LSGSPPRRATALKGKPGKVKKIDEESMRIVHVKFYDIPTNLRSTSGAFWVGWLEFGSILDRIPIQIVTGDSCKKLRNYVGLKREQYAFSFI